MNIGNAPYTFSFFSRHSGLLEIVVQTVREYRLTAVIGVTTMLNLMAESDWWLIPYRITDQGGAVCLQCEGETILFDAPTELVLDVLQRTSDFTVNGIAVEE